MRLVAALLFLFGFAPGLQTQYVLVKPGQKVYHQPFCEQVAAAKNVVAMTRVQAEARGLTQDPACDPATHSPGEKKKAAPVFVYVQPGGKYYHREHCDNAGPSPKKMLLDEAAKKYWPCPVCKPPIRKRGDSGPPPA
jgi:hypothetical protein